MHTKPDLRVFLKWMINRSGSVITDVMSLKCILMKNDLNILLLVAVLAAIGCRTEIGGVTSINEAANAANDPSVIYFPLNESTVTHSRESNSTIRTPITGIVTVVSTDTQSNSSLLKISDVTTGQTFTLSANSNSFTRDLPIHFDGRIAKVVLDVELDVLENFEVLDENVVQYGLPD